MKLKDLKIGQTFKFTKITDRTRYILISGAPQLVYKSVNGYIHYRPTYASRLSKEVILLDETVLPAEIRFADVDGDQTIIKTETEADFCHVMVKTSTGAQIAALSRDNVIQLIEFLNRHLDIKQ